MPHVLAVQAELWRALGALTEVAGDEATPVARSLGLVSPTPADHTEVFVLSCPPYGSIYLGPEGKLGGEATDRVAGFWRVLGMTPPAEPDHLASLLGLYAALSEAEADAGTERLAAGIAAARTTLFFEHLWSFAPIYLETVKQIAPGPLAGLADLTLSLLAGELRGLQAPDRLPLALRSAPEPLGDAPSLDELLDSAIAPLRSGMVLTRTSLRSAAESIGAGYRQGERRFSLKSVVEQAPGATLCFLAAEADRYAAIHDRQPPVVGNKGAGDPRRWWSSRARRSADTFTRLSAEAGAS
jgi:hypothetical protein